MNSISVNLENCYGIRSLSSDFDFQTNGNVYAIYAPNGVMKTSFANTFRDHSLGLTSSDRVWAERPTVRSITDSSGASVLAENIFVIEPYNQAYKSEKVSTLLVNVELRAKFDSIHAEIDQKAENLISKLRANAGFRDKIREELAASITHDPKQFYLALSRVKDEVKEGADSSLGNVVYNHIFNPKVIDTIYSQGFKDKIHAYLEKYDRLLQRSTFFRKGVFTHNNASDIAKSLSTNGFFRAQHSIFLRIDGEKHEITTVNELETAIQTEKDQILTDPNLKKAFEDIDKLLTKNAELKNLRKCLEENPVVLTELENPSLLKQKLWISYLIKNLDAFTILLDAYNSGKEELARIVEEAKDEITKWSEVINIFNQRFSVPFVVRMENQEDVILRSNAPTIVFDFIDDHAVQSSPSATIDEQSLMQILSNGEKRALYILNIIFEVEARLNAGTPTLFIVDDIADSFDYKNKYAIIEYLKEVSDTPFFYQIILSHNFDFYRTVSGRLNLRRQARLFASKTGSATSLNQELYQNSPFSYWKMHLAEPRMLIAAIPFLRNLSEFSGDVDSFNKLTSLLHVKRDTDSITIDILQTLIKSILNDQSALVLPDPEKSAKKLIYEVAEGIVSETPIAHTLEVKVALSIAIRLKAEEIMIQKIADPDFIALITSNQTIALIKRFKIRFPAERAMIRLFEQVNLMTPENIHLNSFMYEPILDLSAEHLKKLFSKLDSLN